MSLPPEPPALIEPALALGPSDYETVLRSLPMWFGQEDALLAYAQDAAQLTTFVATGSDGLQGFVTVKQHFAKSFEIHCIAVHASRRGRGLGHRLLHHAAQWAFAEGGAILLVKTLAPIHPSAAYAQTRAFYEAQGFVPLEIFPTLWSKANPCLQMFKLLC